MKKDNLKNKVNKVYKHHSGKEYLLIGISNIDADKDGYPKTAFYIDRNDTLWSRDIDGFFDKFQETNIKPWMSLVKL